MKSKLLALVAFTALACTASAQTTIISGTIQNGDLELGVAAPFNGNAGTISTLQNHSPGGTNSVEIDLTGNNGNAQWKGITDNPGGPVPSDTDKVTHYLWVYVPSATEFPDGVNGNNAGGLDTNDLNGASNLVINLQRSLDGGAGWGNINGVPTGAFQSLNLKTVTRDKWIQLSKVGVDLPAGTTDVRLNHNFTNSVLIGPAGGLVAADGGDDTLSGADLAGPAMPSDWQASGYSGVIYVDDFFLSSSVPPPPAPAGTLICDVYENGDFEAPLLSPWNPVREGGDIDTVIVHGGTQSMSINLAAPGATNGNMTARWRGMGLSSTLPVTAGDMIGTSAWIYVPSSPMTTFGANGAWFNAELRSDRNMPATAGQGNLTGQLRVDIASLAKDQWVNVTALTEATDGDQSITTINTTGWNVETMDGVDQGALGYGGLIYFDDVKLINLGPGPVSDGAGVMVGPNDNNGDMEGDYPAPWGGIEPWTVSGAGSASSAQDHTTGTGQSVCVDLTANNSNSRWKGIHTTLPALDVVGLGFDRADISAWVYIPAATTFGTVANVNLEVRDGPDPTANGVAFDLKGAARDQWVEISRTNIDISGHVNNFAINNWNIETLKNVGAAGFTVGSDGTDRTGDLTDPADLPGPATAADWQASGYDGVFYIDDVSVVAYVGTIANPLVINSIVRDGGSGDVTINYDSTFVDGADVYRSDDDLSTWTFLGFANGTGTAQDFVDPAPAVPTRMYILVEPGTTPANPNP